jgi:hypothetical protein
LRDTTNIALEDYYYLAHKLYPNHDLDFFKDIRHEVLSTPNTLLSLDNAFFNLLDIKDAIKAITHDTQGDMKNIEV